MGDVTLGGGSPTSGVKSKTAAPLFPHPCPQRLPLCYEQPAESPVGSKLGSIHA